MAVPAKQLYLSVERYLAEEADWPTRREYVDGQVYDRAEASNAHNLLAGNLFVALSNQLADEACVPYQSDMKVKVSEAIYYYPDVLVTCETLEDDDYVCEKPVLIVEVLSRTTRRTDPREKLREYQKMPSVRECALITQSRVAIEV
jgi:Uma2 family endonuclease